jgi:hypothetical protein
MIEVNGGPGYGRSRQIVGGDERQTCAAAVTTISGQGRETVSTVPRSVL